MKKQRIRQIIALCLCVCMGMSTPLPVSAAEKYLDEDVTWLGTTDEYKKTLQSFFDANGYRVMPVGEAGKDGYLTNEKYGIVDKTGKWIAQPIYDEIEAYYLHEGHNGIEKKDKEKPSETIFVNGYVQAVRNGKMGLLDTKGKEVIPCEYDAVGLPSEGMCRLIVKNGKSAYLGYWNLEKGKEVVKPNKYIIDSDYATAAGSVWGTTADENGNYKAAYDFIEGYALVPTGKKETVELMQITGEYGKPSTYKNLYDFGSLRELVYAQIIDKNGKEILPKAYPYLNSGYKTYYPQSGPYMVYYEESKKVLQMKSDMGDHIMYKTHLVGGVAGKKGVVIPAQYHGGIIGNAATGWIPIDADIQILSKSSLVVTNKCATTGFKESAAKRGVVNFKNKTVVPFNSYVIYDKENNVFYDDTYVYRTNGKKVPNIKGSSSYSKTGGTEIYIGDIKNGYTAITQMKTSTKYGVASTRNIKSIVSIKDGKKYSHKNLQGCEASAVSTNKTVWINKGTLKSPKWGLVSLSGKVILPFKYSEVDTGHWLDKKNGYARIKQGKKWGMADTKGKMLLACKYKQIGEPTDGYLTIVDASTGKYGVYSTKAKKITTPCKFDSFSIAFKAMSWGSIAGTVTIDAEGNLERLLDMNTGKVLTDNYLSIKPSGRGVFYNNYNVRFGADGKVIFPKEEKTEDMTLVVKGTKVGYIPASRLARDGVSLPDTPREEPETEQGVMKAYLVKNPEKLLYKVGDTFDATGIEVQCSDENGARTPVDVSELTFITSNNVELTQGRPFTTAGDKTIEVFYKGIKANSFTVRVIDASEENILETGDYYLQIYGKYLSPSYSKGVYYLELSDKKPKEAFHIKLINYDEKNGPAYTIAYDGTYIGQPASKDGAQLTSSNVKHVWRINQYSSFITIRDYGKQKLLVNASGKKQANGTKVTVWTYTGSAPEHGKIKLIKK